MDLNWNDQLAQSAWWLLRAFCITAVALAVSALLARFTGWGRKFWRLAWPYLTPRRSWRPLLTVALLLFLAMFAVRMTVLFSYWYNGFYALQALDQKAFWHFLAIFGVLASVHVLRTLADSYAGQAFDIHWRVWLNERLTHDWLDGRAYYRGHFLDQPVDNPDQRIEQDIGLFVAGTRTLAIGALSAVVSLVEFTAILWGLSGRWRWRWRAWKSRAPWCSWSMYVVIATVFAFRIGRPLIRLSFLSERLTANFRYALVRLRENAENVAFYQGEGVERATLRERFLAYVANLWARVYRGLKFDGFNLAVSQVAVVFPFLLQAPRFFSGAIKLGDMMQTSQAFGQVQDALSFFRTSYDTFAQYRATLDRLSGFLDANEAARAAGRDRRGPRRAGAGWPERATRRQAHGQRPGPASSAGRRC